MSASYSGGWHSTVRPNLGRATVPSTSRTSPCLPRQPVQAPVQVPSSGARSAAPQSPEPPGPRTLRAGVPSAALEKVEHRTLKRQQPRRHPGRGPECTAGSPGGTGGPTVHAALSLGTLQPRVVTGVCAAGWGRPGNRRGLAGQARPVRPFSWGSGHFLTDGAAGSPLPHPHSPGTPPAGGARPGRGGLAGGGGSARSPFCPSGLERVLSGPPIGSACHCFIPRCFGCTVGVC